MFPDPITPKSYPELLASVDYDPFNLMPAQFPAHPYLFATPAQLKNTRKLVANGGWPQRALELLLEQAAVDPRLPTRPPTAPDYNLANAAVKHSLRNAWAALYTDDQSYRKSALRSLRWLARGYTSWPVYPGRGRLAIEDISEAHFILNMARAYDMLAAAPLSNADATLFRKMLLATRDSSDTASHSTCGNHGTGVLLGRLAAAVALQDRRGIHDALYGFQHNNRWCYGIIHQLRHDVLDDGMHWERAVGYHGFTLSVLAYIADLMLSVGVDLWHKPLPPLWQNDGSDIHRDYGTTPGTKTLKAAFDAPFYYTLTNGDFSTLGDSRLENIRGMLVWGTFYHRAYDLYGDPKYAWLINRTEAEYPQAERPLPDLPMALQSPWLIEAEFSRLGRSAKIPQGEFRLDHDADFSIIGTHRNGCSQFAATGATIIRGKPASPNTAAAFMFWGPHAAGHQSPAALHLDISGGGSKLTDAPRMDNRGYSDPLYLTWARTTIAHNTVTVDNTPMFPYDFNTKAIWEADSWRDSISDGRSVLFQHQNTTFKAMRAINERVYPGVLLDRTVIVTATAIIDAFRVITERPRQFDWAMHVVGTPLLPKGTRTASLGDNRGYRHFTNIRRLPTSSQPLTLTWERHPTNTCATFIIPPQSRVFTACDPIPPADKMHTIGEIGNVEPRHTAIIRTKAREALFLSAWSFSGTPLPLKLLKGSATTDLTLTINNKPKVQSWLVPYNPAEILQI